MKKILIQLAVLFALLVPALTATQIVYAQDIPAPSVLEQTGQKLEQSGTKLINPYSHAESAKEKGAEDITSTIWYLIDYIKYFVQGIAIIVIIAGGVMFITAGKDSQKKVDDAKRMLTYGIGSLVIITFGAMFIKRVFYGDVSAPGQVLTSQAMAESFGTQGEALIKTIYGIVEIFVGAVAILFIIINGVRILMSMGDEDAKKKSIKRILFALVGVFIVGIAEFVIKGILFPAHGEKLMAADKAIMLIQGITNFASAFVATIAFVMLIYAGYMYVTAGAEEENAKNAKKILVGAILGLILAAGAYALANTLLKLS